MHQSVLQVGVNKGLSCALEKCSLWWQGSQEDRRPLRLLPGVFCLAHLHVASIRKAPIQAGHDTAAECGLPAHQDAWPAP